MWAGTQNGLCHFRREPPAFMTYKHEPGNPSSLRNDMIWSVQADSHGFLLGGQRRRS